MFYCLFVASFTAYPLEDAFVTGSFTAYPLEDAIVTGSFTAYPLEDAIITGSFTAYPLEDAIITGSFTAYPLEDAIITGSFIAYPLEDGLLLGEYFVFGFAVFAGQKAVLARLIDLVDRVGDAIAGAEDVWRGVEALLIEEDERRLFDIATALCDFGIGEVGVEEQVLRLEESPLRDELAERKAREQLDGATQLACIDAKGLGQFFRFEDIGVQKYVDNWCQDWLLDC